MIAFPRRDNLRRESIGDHAIKILPKKKYRCRRAVMQVPATIFFEQKWVWAQAFKSFSGIIGFALASRVDDDMLKAFWQYPVV